jgi:hypothetical protein
MQKPKGELGLFSWSFLQGCSLCIRAFDRRPCVHRICWSPTPFHRHRRCPAARMDFTLLVFLILLNGLFAMSEMALTASRQTPPSCS